MVDTYKVGGSLILCKEKRAGLGKLSRHPVGELGDSVNTTEIVKIRMV